jgi:ferredoxin--NADP+ reductase
LSFHFYARPQSVRGTAGVEVLDVTRTEVDAQGRAHDTGQTWELATDLLVRSVGYRGEPIPDLPFDPDRGIVPNSDGRVLSENKVAPGQYTAGWIKRGPSGIIGTNKKDAAATVAALLDDLDALPEAPERGLLTAYLTSSGITTVDREGWRRISQEECARGALSGRDRVTIHDREELLTIAR